jgi:hypothetical protein
MKSAYDKVLIIHRNPRAFGALGGYCQQIDTSSNLEKMAGG